MVALSIALLVERRSVLGIIYNPFLETMVNYSNVGTIYLLTCISSIRASKMGARTSRRAALRVFAESYLLRTLLSPCLR